MKGALLIVSSHLLSYAASTFSLARHGFAVKFSVAEGVKGNIVTTTAANLKHIVPVWRAPRR
jgi:hypothetical protein